MALSTPVLPPTKQGDTFALSCAYQQDGAAADITAFTIRSQVRTAAGELVESLIVIKADQATDPGVFTLAAAAPIAWPRGMLQCDIEFAVAGSVRSSQTIKVPVIGDITHD